MSNAPTTNSEDPTPSWRGGAAIEIALIAVLFFLHAGWHAPGVNEPHYLAKAYHYWNNSWCAGDFFLMSRDAHRVFYWSFGWLTLLLPLGTVAWIGRILTWCLLAWAWRGLSWSLIPRFGFGLLSAAIWVALLSNFHLSGEWVIGGVEAKGFAYVLVLLGLRALAQGRWQRVWPLLGAAAAFHVLVGGWSVVAAAIAWCLSRRDAPSLRRMFPSLAAGFALSLPGLVPSLLLNRGVSPEIVAQANEIYVFNRLRHHLAMHTLEPSEIIPRAIANGAMLAVLFVLLRFVPWSPAWRRVRGYVIGSMVIAFCGLVVALLLADDPATAAGLLRFYWFRVYDFALPTGAALFGCAVLVRLFDARRRIGQAALGVVILGVAWHFIPTVAAEAQVDFAPANKHTRPESDWIEACRWIDQNVPADAVFLTPRMSSTFKYYAQRPEVVTQKDIPQDAAGIVQWWDRMDRVHRFAFKNEEGQVERHYRKTLAHQGERMLRNLAHKYGAEYLITRATPKLDFEPIHANPSFAVYRIGPLEADSQSP